MIDGNCISYWYPILQSTGVETPPTEIIKTDADVTVVLDGRKPDGWDDFLAQISAAIDRVGYPCFIRTGHLSAKHQWNQTCFLESGVGIPRHICTLIDESGCADLPTSAWAVRKFIPLEHRFTAFRGMPVTKERRYFIENGNVLCRHPYWPVGCLEPAYARPSVANWRELLAELNQQDDGEIALLTQLSEKVSRSFEGAWSLDWARTQDGRWIALDMAEASRSWHWPDCPVAAERGWK